MNCSAPTSRDRTKLRRVVSIVSIFYIRIDVKYTSFQYTLVVHCFIGTDLSLYSHRTVIHCKVWDWLQVNTGGARLRKIASLGMRAVGGVGLAGLFMVAQCLDGVWRRKIDWVTTATDLASMY